MTRETMATLAFAGYASLTAFRDVMLGERFGPEMDSDKSHYLWITFATCAVILILSTVHVLLSKQHSLMKKLRMPGAMFRVIMLGLLCGGIYLGFIYTFSKLGAGLGGLIDNGLGPFIIALVGWLMFKEKLTTNFFVALLISLVGLSILMITTKEFKTAGFLVLVVAVVTPVASAYSDGYVKWLLDEKNAGLTKGEVLAVRFLPAVLILYVIAATYSKSLVPQMNRPYEVVAVAAVGSWLPLMLLCTGLGIAGMKKLASWEISIPVFTFLITLTIRQDHATPLAMLGAALIVAGVVMSEKKIFTRLLGRIKGNTRKITPACFISYSNADEEFAKQLSSRLRGEHLRVWFAPEKMKGGEKLSKQIEQAIQNHDKLLLVLSRDSMQSEWVMTEIRNARRIELEEEQRKLFPIRLVDFEEIKRWKCFDAESGKDLAIEVREYFIPDFSNWRNRDAFEEAFERLLHDLKAEKLNLTRA